MKHVMGELESISLCKLGITSPKDNVKIQPLKDPEATMDKLQSAVDGFIVWNSSPL
jgi:hypothetical protein